MSSHRSDLNQEMYLSWGERALLQMGKDQMPEIQQHRNEKALFYNPCGFC